MQKNRKIDETLEQMGTHMKVLSKRFPMNTNMTRFRWFSKIFVLWTKVASALEGLRGIRWPFHTPSCNGVAPSVLCQEDDILWWRATAVVESLRMFCLLALRHLTRHWGNAALLTDRWALAVCQLASRGQHSWLSHLGSPQRMASTLFLWELFIDVPAGL